MSFFNNFLNWHSKIPSDAPSSGVAGNPIGLETDVQESESYSGFRTFGVPQSLDIVGLIVAQERSMHDIGSDLFGAGTRKPDSYWEDRRAKLQKAHDKEQARWDALTPEEQAAEQAAQRAESEREEAEAAQKRRDRLDSLAREFNQDAQELAAMANHGAEDEIEFYENLTQLEAMLRRAKGGQQ